MEKCKSKEEVARLNERKLTQFITEADGIIKNPNIPKAKKAEKLEFIMMRMAGVMNDHTQFQNSEKYKRLPDKTDERDAADSGVEVIISWDQLKPERQASPGELFRESMERLKEKINEALGDGQDGGKTQADDGETHSIDVVVADGGEGTAGIVNTASSVGVGSVSLTGSSGDTGGISIEV